MSMAPWPSLLAMCGTSVLLAAGIWYPLRAVASWPLAGGATILFEPFILFFLACLGAMTAYVGAVMRNENPAVPVGITGVAGLAVLVASGGVGQAFADLREHLALVMRADAAGRFIIWVLFAPWAAPLAASGVARWASWCHNCGRLYQRDPVRVLLFDNEDAKRLDDAIRRGSLAACVDRAKYLTPASHADDANWNGPVVRIRACRRCGAGQVLIVGQQPSTAPLSLIGGRALSATEASALVAACDEVIKARTAVSPPGVDWRLAAAFWGTLLATIGALVYFLRGAILRFLEG